MLLKALCGLLLLVCWFLSETKTNEIRMEYVRRVLSFDGCVVVDASSFKSDLAVLWKNEVNISVDYLSNHIIGVTFNFTAAKVWKAWFCYGPTCYSLKRIFWRHL